MRGRRRRRRRRRSDIRMASAIACRPGPLDLAASWCRTPSRRDPRAPRPSADQASEIFRGGVRPGLATVWRGGAQAALPETQAARHDVLQGAAPASGGRPLPSPSFVETIERHAGTGQCATHVRSRRQWRKIGGVRCRSGRFFAGPRRGATSRRGTSDTAPHRQKSRSSLPRPSHGLRIACERPPTHVARWSYSDLATATSCLNRSPGWLQRWTGLEKAAPRRRIGRKSYKIEGHENA